MNKFVKGYVLNITKYKENDGIVSILTSSGIESYKARAIYKLNSKFGNLLQSFMYGEFEICYPLENQISFIKDIQDYKINKSIYSDFNKFTLLSFVAESILKDPDLSNKFLIFDTVFKMIDQDNYNFKNIVLIVLKNHLLSNGSLLEADCCCKCGKKNNVVAVSFKDGGFLCSNCNPNPSFIKPNEFLIAYRYVIKADITKSNSFTISDEIFKELFALMYDELVNNVGIKLNTESLLLENM